MKSELLVSKGFECCHCLERDFFSKFKWEYLCSDCVVGSFQNEKQCICIFLLCVYIVLVVNLNLKLEQNNMHVNRSPYRFMTIPEF